MFLLKNDLNNKMPSLVIGSCGYEAKLLAFQNNTEPVRFMKPQQLGSQRSARVHALSVVLVSIYQEKSNQSQDEKYMYKKTSIINCWNYLV